MIKKLLLCLSLLSVKCYAQEMPIGYWRSHLPYNDAITIATDGVTVFSGSTASFFTCNAANDEITTYSKSEGMADVGIATIGYDQVTDYTIITYTNGNIDLFKDETFFNIPDIKLKTISPKKINNIYTENGLAYLSTSFGVVVLNLDKKETKETYSFVNSGQMIEVKEFTAEGNFFYAVTSNGLYKARKTEINLQEFSVWKSIDKRTNLVAIASMNNQVFIASKDTLFRLNADTLAFVYKSIYEIKGLTADGSDLFIEEYNGQAFNGKIKILDIITDQVKDSLNVQGNPSGTAILSDKSIWVADAYNGLGKRNGNELSFIKPQGPASSGAFDILPYNGDVWVAHGGYDENWTYIYNGSGLSHYKDGSWTTYTDRNFPAFNGVTDFITLAKDPADGTLYAGSYKDGLFILRPDGSHEMHKGPSDPYVENHYLDLGSYRTAGVTFDLEGNLWINNSGAIHELTVKTKDGNIYKYSGAGNRTYGAYVTVDDNNLKWYILPNEGNGVAIYDDNYTPESPVDDQAARIYATQYDLNSFVNCIAKDKQNAIWLGTNDGIGVINCSPSQIFSGQCEIRKPIVQYDQFPGYLFQNEKVRTIAVDGANRKWIGTTNGIWLISADGDKIIYRFTAENSPMPSNNVQKIAVDPVTGDVYVGTSAGLVSYRSTATGGTEANQNVVAFPNPVESGYSGPVAIRGLVENADVRITDIAGQLIYRTRALGGQAVWNGLDYTGRRPQSGVYLIFVTNKDGSQTHVGKMVFME